MEFVVLGPVQVLHDDGTRVRLASDAQRRLVSLLALRANTIVRSEVLEEFLDLSAGALRTSVSRLRRTVGFDVLVTAPPGYELRTDRVDALRFERLITEAAGFPDGDDAARRLGAALHLWQGQPYEEFSHEPWAQAEAQRLIELRAGSVERLAMIEIEQGDWSAAIARLEELIAEQPYRDGPRRLLMEALARSGRRPDALRTFQDYRDFLLEEVGTEPSAEIVALDRKIGAALDEGAPGARADIAPELPTPWTSYVGRALDTVTVVDLVRTHRLVTLTGAGGCGKTRLALAAAHVLRDQGDPCVRWADLIPVSTAEGVAERVLAAVGGVALPGRDATDLLVRWLRGGPATVLVLDNAEHQRDAVARLVHTVLRSCPEVSVLVTSREPLGVAAEHIWRVPALAMPAAAGCDTLDDALRSEAARLLLERVTAARPGLDLGDGDVGWLVSICRSVDGLPLALELAAASIRALPPQQVASNLHETLALLGHGPASDAPHHQTMRASIAWSFGTLDPCAQTVLRRIAVCVQAFTAETAVEVAADGEGIDATAARAALCSLVDKNLVHLSDATGRYRLMETTRQFCHDIDDPSTRADIDAARARLARHVAEWCLAVGRGERGIDRAPFVAEMPQVVSAGEWARQHDPVSVIDMCRGLASIRSVLGHGSDLAATWRWILAFDRDGPLAAQWAGAAAALLTTAAASELEVDGIAAAIEERLAADDHHARRWLTRGLAMGPAFRGCLDASQRYARDITASGNDLEISVYVGFTAYMSAMCGQLREVDRWLDELRRMTHRQHETFRVDTVGNGVAAALLADVIRGRLDHASALAAGPVPHDPAFSGTASAALAQLALLSSSKAMLDMATEWGGRETIVLLRFLPTLNDFYRASFEGDSEHAAVLAAECWDAAAAVPVSRVHQRAMLNVPLLETGRLDLVRAATRECALLVGDMGSVPYLEAVVHQSRAQLALAADDLETATASGTELLRRAMTNGFALAEVDAREILGVAAHLGGSTADAAELLGSARDARARLGYRHVMVAPRSRYDRALADVLEAGQRMGANLRSGQPEGAS